MVFCQVVLPALKRLWILRRVALAKIVINDYLAGFQTMYQML